MGPSDTKHEVTIAFMVISHPLETLLRCRQKPHIAAGDRETKLNEVLKQIRASE